MDYSVKRILFALVMGVSLLVVIGNLKSYFLVNIDTSTIRLPMVITIGEKQIKAPEVIKKIYRPIIEGNIRETQMRKQYHYHGNFKEISADYEEDKCSTMLMNDLKKGHVHRLYVFDDDTISFEYYLDDSFKAKDYRVVTVRSKGIYEYIKSIIYAEDKEGDVYEQNRSYKATIFSYCI